MSRALTYLAALDIPLWARRPGAVFPGAGETEAAETLRPDSVPADAPPAPTVGETWNEAAPPIEISRPALPPPPDTDWDGLAAQVQDCSACPLHKTRTQTVFGVGNRHAEWMIVGEAPGQEEDKQGEPFVGQAGLLLNAMLEGIGLTREMVYIANVIKCRPPGNRNPTPKEMACCGPFLARQIALVQPRLIIALGGVAANYLLQVNTLVGHLRGTQHRYGDSGIPLMVTYHPAYLLRRPLEKRKAWQDLQTARHWLEDK